MVTQRRDNRVGQYQEKNRRETRGKDGVDGQKLSKTITEVVITTCHDSGMIRSCQEIRLW